MLQEGNRIECAGCKNSACFIKQCSPEWVERMSQSKNQSIYKSGRNIIVEGQPVFGIYFVQHGKVKVTSTNADGNEQIVRLATDGHILGHRGYSQETYPIGAVAMTDSVICFFDNQILHDAFMANPNFTYHLMLFYSMELRKMEQRIKCFAQMTVMEKVACALHYIMETFGFDEDEQSLSIPLSRQEIANIAGTTADQVSRQITLLKNDGVIDTSGKMIIIKNEEMLGRMMARYACF
ncbi:MAG: Crp/Fnr family transcriptional regulator [Saprospiraceae bacterium]|nr:MAG: Crp/Fnr family transcriptional regulator [Saprospiraceae bacterium]